MFYRIAQFIKARPATMTLIAVFTLLVGPVVWLPAFQATLWYRLDAINRASPAAANTQTSQAHLILWVVWYAFAACWLAAFVLFAYGLRKVLKKQWPIVRR